MAAVECETCGARVTAEGCGLGVVRVQGETVCLHGLHAGAVPSSGSTTTWTVTFMRDRPFLSSPRCANRNTRRAYAGALDRLADRLGDDRTLADIDGHELATALEVL